jgi:hypothetical protein
MINVIYFCFEKKYYLKMLFTWTLSKNHFTHVPKLIVKYTFDNVKELYGICSMSILRVSGPKMFKFHSL